MNTKDIPIIIINRDRLTCLKQLIEWCQSVGQRKIVVIDNLSTYPPLLEFYDNAKGFAVRRMPNNTGSRALWDDPGCGDLISETFVYTDCDTVPIEECPKDAIEFLYSLLYEYFPQKGKIAMGLRLDDIPGHYALKDVVISWESQFWDGPYPDTINNTTLYEAVSDTTFAMYRSTPRPTWDAIRTGYPYLVRHLGWYVDSENPSSEDLYYEQHVEHCHSWGIRDCSFEPAVEKYNKEKK